MQHRQISHSELERYLQRGREERAKAMQRVLRAGAARVTRAVRTAATALTHKLSMNATIRKLDMLEDRLLDDIGITRAEIADFAQGRIRPRRAARTAPIGQDGPASETEPVVDAAHELKTPLTAILSISEILRDNPDLPRARRQEFLGIVIAESERLDRAIDQVLNPPRAA